ncbi:hypothetical protein D3C80_1621870 [compost metagenome]
MLPFAAESIACSKATKLTSAILRPSAPAFAATSIVPGFAGVEVPGDGADEDGVDEDELPPPTLLSPDEGDSGFGAVSTTVPPFRLEGKLTVTAPLLSALYVFPLYSSVNVAF